MHTRNRHSKIAWTFACLSFAWCLPAFAASERLPPIGFEALVDGLDALPLLVDWPAYQDSSYHRDDINQDAGNFLRVEPNGDQVLVDAEGPGVVYRIWSTGVVGTQMSKDCRLRFYFDGESEPRLDLSMPELFGAEGSRWPFVPPHCVTFESGVGGGEGPCNLCYLPIPFAKHLKIVGRNVMFYHVDYHRLPPGTPIESFSLELAEKNRDRIERGARILGAIPARPGGSDGDAIERRESFALAPGGSVELRREGEGCIGTIRLKLGKRSGRALRGVVLECAFESPENATVRVPAGDFFGSGCGDRRFQSLPCGMLEEGYYAYWPMPFRKLAIVRLRNELSETVPVERLEVGWFLRPQPSNAGYFHARYVEDHDIPFRKDYTILAVEGRGKFVGANVSMQNARGAQGIFYLEGDEKIYVDGEKYPSRWLGTGTEDYFNGAYFWNAPNKAEMARPLGGLTFLDWGIGRVCAYRWHIPDFISFTRDIRVDLEHGGVSDWPSHYASVAYYYLSEPKAQDPLPPLAARLPKPPLPTAPRWTCCEPGGKPSVAGVPLSERKFPELDPEYSSEDGALVGRVPPSASVRIPLKVPGGDRFTVVLCVVGGPEYGRFRAALDGKELGIIDARREVFAPWLAFELGPIRIDGGERSISLEPAPEAGAEARETSIGLVAVQLRPHSRFVDAWSTVGNWPCPKEGGWEVAHPPELHPDPEATYRLPDGAEVRWKPYEGDRVWLGGGDWLVAYGLTYVWSPDDREVGCFIGKDDGLKLWVGEDVVFDQYTWSHSTPDQFHSSARLKRGWNRVLVKCANFNGAWGFAVRFGDPEGELRYARRPER